jgi:hypothetical protein
MELVKNLHTDPVASKMRAGFVQGVRAAMGIKKKVCHTGANLGLQPLLTETEVVPWDIQVQTQAVRLPGKLRQGEVQAPSNKLAGELGKALADAKLHTTGRTRENSFLQGALPHARKWGTPFAQPVGKLAKEEWKRCLREAAKEDVEKAGRGSLQIRGADPEDGGRQSNTKFVQLVNRSNIGREARRMRELIPSRTLRVGMKNLKLGALQHARGSQAKTQPGWASLGEDMQTRMLKCPWSGLIGAIRGPNVTLPPDTQATRRLQRWKTRAQLKTREPPSSMRRAGMAISRSIGPISMQFTDALENDLIPTLFQSWSRAHNS